MLTADVSGFLISVAMYLLVPIIVEFVQIPRSAGYGFAASLVVSGLVLIPLSVGSFVASRFLVAYERRFGPRTMIPLGSVVFAVAATFFAVEHSALWEAFVTVAVCGLGVGFTTGAMPGFIVRAVPQSETGSATGFYQVVRSIGLTVGSALSAAVLMAHTRPGQALPDVDGFEAALIIAAALCLATAVVSFVLPGRAPSPPAAPPRRRTSSADEEEAELGGAGLAAGEPLPRDRRRIGREHERRDDGSPEEPGPAGPGTPRPARTPCSRRPRPSSASRGSRARRSGRSASGPGSTPLSSPATSAARPTSTSPRWLAEDAEGTPSEYEGLEQMADVVMTRADQRGPGPILQAIVRSDTSAEIRDAALDRLARRLVGPLVASMTAQGVDRPELRAQVAVSALFGISLGRSLGWFDEIRSVPRDELVALIVDALGAITGDGPER